MRIPFTFLQRGLLAGAAATLAWSAQAVEIVFKPVAPNVYAYVGDIEGRTYENEAINANIGLVVTPAGALLIDSGASFQGAKQIAEAAKKVTAQPSSGSSTPAARTTAGWATATSGRKAHRSWRTPMPRPT
ncbi:hypothetical protein Y695_02401 [Hydrogenophaga sp. T4]|nr:hypothetical protein Y695_02401 [Hydrogenophaga sp. T4]